MKLHILTTTGQAVSQDTDCFSKNCSLTPTIFSSEVRSRPVWRAVSEHAHTSFHYAKQERSLPLKQLNPFQPVI